MPHKLLFVGAITLLSASIFSACGSSSDDGNDGNVEKADKGDKTNGALTGSALVGSWTFTGSVPAHVTFVATMNHDGTFQFVEQVAPATTPAGSSTPQAVDCVTSDNYAGTYTDDGDGHVTWTITSGTVNQVRGCEASAPGTPIAPADADAYRTQGLLPPASTSYTITGDTLVLTPGLGFGASTTLSRTTAM